MSFSALALAKPARPARPPQQHVGEYTGGDDVVFSYVIQGAFVLLGMHYFVGVAWPIAWYATAYAAVGRYAWS